MMQHTPGPWIVVNLDDGTVIERRSEPRQAHESYRIAEVAYSDEEFDEQNDANARLLAAAPDMLTVLKEWFDPCDSLAGLFANREQTEKALARAHAVILAAESR